MFLQKARRCRDSSSSSLLLRYNTHAFWKTTLTIQANVDPHIFYSDTSLVFGKILVHSVEKTHGLVVTVELIWFLFYNILSFNFVQTPNKSLRFRRFSRSYVHQSVVVPSNRSQSCTACFFLMCAVQNDHIPFFWRLFVPSESVFA